MWRAAIGWCGVALLATATTGQGAVILGQLDSFEDGTTQGWSIGSMPGGVHPAPPANIATGGPAGADDNYLQLTALGGQGPGSRLSVFNRSQWAGDYLAAGISRIQLDVRNLGPEDVVLRLAFFDGAAGPPANAALTDGVPVPAGGDWQRIEFLTSLPHLTSLLGDTTAAMSNVTELRIFHNPDPIFSGPNLGPPPVTVVLAVDNIRAVPEPGWELALVALSFCWVGLSRRWVRLPTERCK